MEERMRKVVALVLGAVLVGAVAASADCGRCPGDKAAAEKKAACGKTDLYACAMCKTVAEAAGKCPACGMDMVRMRVLECKAGQAKLCACAADCACTIQADDATKCSCGKDVVTVTVKDLPSCARRKGACRGTAE